jgi:HEAT repeat protein
MASGDSRPQRFAAVLAAAGLAACGRPPPLHVDSVRVSNEPGALVEAGLDASVVERAARDGLAAAGFRLEAGGARTYRARAEVGSVRIVPQRGGARAEVAIEIELLPSGTTGDPVRESATGTAPLGAGDPGTAFREALAQGARSAAAGLALGFAAERKSEGELVRDLSSEDPRTRDHAVRALGDRRSAAAVPVLVERLRDDDPQVQHRTVAALALIRDPRAVNPLIDLSRRSDPAVAARLARIIGDIGGQEAEGYLLTLEAGHPDPRVRRAAREALAEMAARPPSAPPASPPSVRPAARR